ncbi:hypothetical protein DKK76_02625 [Frischella perrara]|uniref:RCC1-like domain-containing protein n=1 Tax=Frischella perrara TaxID=1267021 RepID=A0A318MTP5_FRIPE|nr:hypothetical protein [Frischella perrara]PXY96699.1 hypothetical protein DKK76_02625 [Frischella perrara]
MSTINTPISVRLNTQDSEFVPTGKSVLIPLEIEILENWCEVTIDFSFYSSNKNLVSPTIEITPIVLKNLQYQPITETMINMVVYEEGFYDVEAKITATFSEEESVSNENKLVTTLSFGVFSTQDKYIYAHSSQTAFNKYTAIEATNDPVNENNNLTKLEKTQFIDSSSPQEQMEDISHYQSENIQKIKNFTNSFKTSLFSQPQSRLALKKGQNATLKVQWPIDNRYNSFLPLDQATIEVNGCDGSLFKGVLNNGQFTFTVPQDNFTFNATIFAENANKFGIFSEQNPNYLIKTTFSNQLEYNITDSTAPCWSVFQAITDLVDITKRVLNFERQNNRKIYVNSRNSNSFYNLKDESIHIGNNDFYDWDVIAHEFGHAIAHESNSVNYFTGAFYNGVNQYDYSYNNTTYRNKSTSLALAFNEGYGIWIGVRLLKESNYANKMPFVGDDIYTDKAQNGCYQLDIDLRDHKTLCNIYGEDAQEAIAKLLWQLGDKDKRSNIRALCSYPGTEVVSYSLEKIFNNVFRGKKLNNISDFYIRMFANYVGVEIDYMKSVALGSRVNKTILEKIHNLAMPFAEFGVGVVIDDTKTQGINQLVWSQLKTGSLPGHDQFDIYFFSSDLSTLAYKIQDRHVGNGNEMVQQDGTTYSYALQKKDITELLAFSSRQPHQDKTLYVLIAATATGKTACYGELLTGPYFSNLAKFKVPESRKTVIAVDSSGSNIVTDPHDLRIVVAHDLLKTQADRNNDIFNGIIKNERVVQTAAMDFDSFPKFLPDPFRASFKWPDELYDLRIFKDVDSFGGTDIAEAIKAAIKELKEHDSKGQPISKPSNERNSLYLITDMSNNKGDEPVKESLNKAEFENIKVHIGHLQPFGVIPPVESYKVESYNGDFITTRERVAFDDVIESILKTGGSYAVVENANYQQAWMELADYLDHNDLDNLKEIDLPLNVCFYSLGKAGKNTPTYLITPKKSGEVTITVDGKGNFVPNLTINGVGQQKDIGQDCYEIKLRAKAGRTYAVELNKPLNSQGLYSIVARLPESKSICEGDLVKTGAALTQTGDVYVWGYRAYGQQGNGTNNVKANSAPQKVTGLANIEKLVGGTYHLLALDADGKVWGWGENRYGQAGFSGNYTSTPRQILTQVEQISAGEQFSMALDNTGQAWVWGINNFGQLGNTWNYFSNCPIKINFNCEKVRLIGCASNGAFAVTEQGHVWAWGSNETCGLGINKNSGNRQNVFAIPVHVTSLDKYADKIIYIGGGIGWGEALLDDGTVIGWGLKAALGLGFSVTNQVSTEPVVIMKDVEQLFVRYKGSFALTKDGKLYTWGQTLSNAPQMIYGEKPTLRQGVNSKIIRIGGGMEHLFYQTEKGDIYGVGYNGEYKLNQNEAEGANIDWPGIKISLS